MLVVKILCFLLGLAFFGFGYFIFFRKRFDLINGFENDRKDGRKTEKNALRVGLVEFVLGAALLAAGLLLVIFC